VLITNFSSGGHVIDHRRRMSVYDWRRQQAPLAGHWPLTSSWSGNKE